MCGYCGCGQSEGSTPAHHHDHSHDDRLVQIEQDILSENQRFADENRRYFKQHNITALNLVSSPGSGKTTLLVETIQELKAQYPLSVIEGDQQTDLDLKRIEATGVPALQVNTGKSCHLDAHSISHALGDLSPVPNSLLFIENVGNLVCPALFDLGEMSKVVILSVTEGEDKPLKYPYMFHESSLMIINKIDLLPHVNFNVDKCVAYARQINPTLDLLKTSATTRAGLQDWVTWLTKTNEAIAS